MFDHDQLASELKHAPSIKLLRRDNAALILSFLYQTFKHTQKVNLTLEQLTEQLDSFLETLNDPQPRYPLAAAAYIKQWADEDHQLLRIIARSNDEIVVELTVDAERAMSWVEELTPRELISTESRLRSIIQLLEDVVAQSNANVAFRLEQLERERAALDAEIEAIRTTGEVKVYNSTQIKERFLHASDLARQMTRDFAAVEQNFRSIARTLQEQQLRPDARKGSLVGYVLEADDELRASDQGRSFYAFWEFLMSPSQQEQLAQLIDVVYQLDPIAPLARDYPLLRRLTRALIAAGGNIVQSNHRLAEQVRRLLDDRALAESRRVRELITDIKHAARLVVDQPPTDEPFAWLEGLPEVELVMEKPLWEPRAEVQITLQPIDVGQAALTDERLQVLYQQFYIDEDLLQRRIETVLETQPECTLSDLLQHYPAEKGIAEVIAYVGIAARDARHQIDDNQQEMIALPALDNQPHDRLLTLPRVLFRSAYAR